MKKTLAFGVIFVLCIVLSCVCTYADSVDFTYTQVASNDFETNNVYKTHYTNAGSGGTIETSTAYAHSGTHSLKRTVTTSAAGFKVYDVFDDILKEENIGKRYRVSAYVYTPCTEYETYQFTLSTVEEGGYTLRNQARKYGVKPNTWTKITLFMTLAQSDITNGTNSVRLCQIDAASETAKNYATEFYMDDVLVEEVTENRTVSASGFTTYFSTDVESGEFVDGFTPYTDNMHTGYGYKFGGGATGVESVIIINIPVQTL